MNRRRREREWVAAEWAQPFYWISFSRARQRHRHKGLSERSLAWRGRCNLQVHIKNKQWYCVPFMYFFISCPLFFFFFCFLDFFSFYFMSPVVLFYSFFFSRIFCFLVFYILFIHVPCFVFSFLLSSLFNFLFYYLFNFFPVKFRIFPFHVTCFVIVAF